MIDVSLWGPAAAGDGYAPVLGQGISLPAARWRQVLPLVVEAVARSRRREAGG